MPGVIGLRAFKPDSASVHDFLSSYYFVARHERQLSLAPNGHPEPDL
jgi:hypothetical protein